MPSTNTFANVPSRINGTNVDANWWNILAQAGINVEKFLGSSGFQAEATFAVVNNQAVAADVTGALFAGAAIRSFEFDYQIYRNTTGAGATELAERGKIYGVYSTVAATWEITIQSVGNGGVIFSITALGQLQYTSTNITGTAATSVMHYRYTTMGI